MLPLIRKLRHGPFRHLGPVWTLLGGLYRGILRTLNLQPIITMRIGPYGPFKLDGRFAFSNYETWGTGKNAAFQTCVKVSSGARCVLDIGAHIGLVALPVSKVLAPTGRVYAFEPAAFNRTLLQRHIELNRATNIEVVSDLVGESDKDGVAFFERNTDTGLNTVALHPGLDSFVKTEKSQICVDTFCGERGIEPDVIKIDVEGAEIGVLKGAAITMRDSQPTIFLSVHPNHLQVLGQDIEELHHLVGELGYTWLTVEGSEAKSIEAAEYMLKSKVTN